MKKKEIKYRLREMTDKQTDKQTDKTCENCGEDKEKHDFNTGECPFGGKKFTPKNHSPQDKTSVLPISPDVRQGDDGEANRLSGDKTEDTNIKNGN